MSIVSCGSQSPVSLKAFSPARTSLQEMVFPYFAAAASRTSLAAGQMSTPVPSPSMNGMMGWSETDRVPSSAMVILSGMRISLLALPTEGVRAGRPSVTSVIPRCGRRCACDNAVMGRPCAMDGA